MTNIFLKVLELSLTGSYVILFVLAARWLLRKSSKWCSYLLWSVVFVRLILPVVPETTFSLVPAGVGSVNVYSTNIEDANKDDILSDTSNVFVNPPQNVLGGEISNFEDNIAEDVVSLEITPNEASKGLDKAGSTDMMLPVFCFIWLTGAVLIGGYHFASYYKFKNKWKNAVLTEPGVYEIPGEHISFVMGIFKPAIYLSNSLDAESRKVVLCHEQVHLKRRDYLIKPLALAITCVHWFNPFVWLAFYLMGRDCEMSCDEKVVSILGEESKKTYSYALLDEATNGARMKYKRESMCAVLSFGEDSIKWRIKHVLHYRKMPIWLMGVSVVVLIVLILGLSSNSVQDNRTSENLEQTGTEPSSVQQENLEQVLESWAEFFVQKDAESLRKLTVDKKAFDRWDLINSKTENGYSFGYSSPWPRAGDYKILSDWQKTGEAEIYYYMRNYIPEVFVARERLTVTEQEGLFYLDNKEFLLFADIPTREAFLDAYVQQLDRKNVEELLEGEEPWFGWVRNTGFDKNHAKAILYHVISGTNPEYYDAYKDPVTAAKMLLNLGEGTGKVANEYLYLAHPQVPSSSGIGEGTVVKVTYTFAADGSTIDIPMVLIDECQGVWMLSAGDFSETSGRISGVLNADADFMSKKVLEEYEDVNLQKLQITDFGIYRTTLKGMEYLTDNYGGIGAKYAATYKNEDGQSQLYVYFLTDSRKYYGALEWFTDSICEINVTTGEMRYLPLDILEMGVDTTNIENFHVVDGYIGLNNNYYPLPDAQKVWKGKTTAQLSVDEKDEYSVAVREKILENTGKIIPIGNRYEDGTTAIIDLDGDGVRDTVSISKGSEKGQYYLYDNYMLRVNGKGSERYGNKLRNEIYAFSLDGEEIYLALYEEGLGAEPKATFFSLQNGILVEEWLDNIALAE